jgi:hypothetical protein
MLYTWDKENKLVEAIKIDENRVDIKDHCCPVKFRTHNSL